MSVCGRILCSLSDVSLSAVLRSGQSFRWIKLESEEWAGPLGRYLWILRQDETGINFKMISTEGEPSMHLENAKIFLADYFQLGVSLPDLYKTWSDADEAFRSVGAKLPGVRMLRQDPVENLFCFICSSNNNIQRITSMVESLCARYGEPITAHAGRAFHAFPSVSALAAEGVESELRALGFGYRARYISQTARQVSERGGARWLHGLRRAEYPECHEQLRRLCGVGAKVADCVCLMSLDQPEAVPVDTHVHQLAARHYLPQLRHLKTLTDRAYREVADHFRGLFGGRAGWAQAVLFCGDLNEFKKPSETPTTPKISVNPAKVGDKSLPKCGAKKSATNSSAKSTKRSVEVVPVKRKRSTAIAGENNQNTPKASPSVRPRMSERNKRR